MATSDMPTKDYVSDLTDSRRWQAFQRRPGDIVVCTPPKSGTTWTQGILALLISGDPQVDAETSMKSPWIDIALRPLEDVMARLDAQDHRRHVKTHTPMDGIPIWSDLRYITVHRHPIDVHFSYRKHAANQKKAMFVSDRFPDDPSESFRIFVNSEQNDGGSLIGVVEHYKSTLLNRERENLLRLHYSDMLRDLTGAMAQIAAHVGISHPPDVMASLVEAATFDSMQANAHRFTPSAGQDFWHKDAAFFDSATSNKWEGQLTADDLAAYDARISEWLTPEERQWLEWGQGAD